MFPYRVVRSDWIKWGQAQEIWTNEKRSLDFLYTAKVIYETINSAKELGATASYIKVNMI